MSCNEELLRRIKTVKKIFTFFILCWQQTAWLDSWLCCLHNPQSTVYSAQPFIHRHFSWHHIKLTEWTEWTASEEEEKEKKNQIKLKLVVAAEVEVKVKGEKNIEHFELRSLFDSGFWILEF